MAWKTVVVVGVVEGVIGYVATQIFEAVIESPGYRANAVVAMWFAVVLVGGALVGIRWWRHPEGEPQPLFLGMRRKVRRANGDMVVRQVWMFTKRRHESYAAHLDLDTWSMRELTLGQIALLRRVSLRVARPATPRHKCEAILRFAGCSDPADVLHRLDGRNLITEVSPGRVAPTDEGKRVARAFSRLLTHDPGLVAAYRQVTLKVDQGIRLDGGSLVPGDDVLAQPRGV